MITINSVNEDRDRFVVNFTIDGQEYTRRYDIIESCEAFRKDIVDLMLFNEQKTLLTYESFNEISKEVNDKSLLHK